MPDINHNEVVGITAPPSPDALEKMYRSRLDEIDKTVADMRDARKRANERIVQLLVERAKVSRVLSALNPKPRASRKPKDSPKK